MCGLIRWVAIDEPIDVSSLYKANNHKEKADLIISIINDKALFKQLQSYSIEIAKGRTLEKSVERLVKFFCESDYI